MEKSETELITNEKELLNEENQTETTEIIEQNSSETTQIDYTNHLNIIICLLIMILVIRSVKE